MYPVPDQETEMILKSSPGLSPWYQGVGITGPVRGMATLGENIYAAIGENVYRISPVGVATLLGALQTKTGPVQIEVGRLQIAFCDAAKLYVYTMASQVFARVTALWFNPGTITFLDNYLVASTYGSDQWGISGINDFTAWNALQFATAEARPDKVLSVIADHRELMLLGEKTIEPWNNTGAADFTFSRISGSIMETGCGAAYSTARGDESFFWISDQGLVMRAAGYQPQIISTRYLERRIKNYERFDDAIGWCQIWNGHTWYVITFPTANETWIFDSATKLWHRRASFYKNGRYRGQCYTMANGKHFVGDYENPIIYELSDSVFADGAEELRRSVQSTTVEEEGAFIPHRELRLIFDMGRGLESGQGVDPLVTVRYSDDGGMKWSNDRQIPIGKIGEHERRATLFRLGASRQRIYETVLTDPVTEIIHGCYLNPKGA
jgi:hypothetical protein